MFSLKNIRKSFQFQIYRWIVIDKISRKTFSSSCQKSVQSASVGGRRKLNVLPWITVGLGSYLGYKYFQNLPPAYAAVPTGTDRGSISGHRAKFNFIADVVSVSAPSVVYIEIKDTRRRDWTGELQTVSNGSGFIVEDGLILTNAHVVIAKKNTTLNVKLFDGRVFLGHIETVDPQSDLATVRIQCKGLPAMKLGKSSELRAGEFVVAMGSPLSLSNTVTSGVVSSTLRASQELGLRGKDMNYIQTDAAITFGNSGGPLVNLDGEAIGINSMKVTPGISFAIPIDYAKEFLRVSAEMRRAGETSKSPTPRRFLGITMISLTHEILAELKQKHYHVPGHVRNGVLIWKVIVGSPAYNAGILPGDIITEINGKAATCSQDVYDALSQSTDLTIFLWRGSTRLKMTIHPDDTE